MDSQTYSYNVETYSLFTHVDDSLLLLNPVLEKWGYQFRCISLEIMERDFSDLVGLKMPYDGIGVASIGYSGKNVSSRFFEAVQNQKQFGLNMLLGGDMVLLKRSEDYKRLAVDSVIDIDESFLVINNMSNFTQMLIHHLRLIKNCLADCLLQFHISNPQREVVGKYEGVCKKSFAKASVDLTEKDIERFSRQFSDKIEINAISKIGYDAFTLAHDIADPGIEFITLMTALESIFNTTGDQISHTVSRHVAVIFSSNRHEFDLHYRTMKKLYGIRSKLVHGVSVKSELIMELDTLKTYAREALSYSLRYEKSKDELFNYLNAKGFPD